MENWEYYIRPVFIERSSTEIGTVQFHFRDDLHCTEWKLIEMMGNDGWELISITPIINDNRTTELMLTYKRPKTS